MHPIDEKAIRVIRWIARISSGLTVALILLIFIDDGLAEGFEPILHLTTREIAMMVAFIAVWLGLALGWKWELFGGLLTICGMAAFYLLDYAFSGIPPRPLFPDFCVSEPVVPLLRAANPEKVGSRESLVVVGESRFKVFPVT